MARPSDIRRLALIVLYQLDARGGADLDAVRDSITDPTTFAEDDPAFARADIEFTQEKLDAAFDLGSAAYAAREVSDAEMLCLAPEWPAKRQAAVDRAILRLAHFEMTTGRTPPKVAVNEAVELAKSFGTDKSPAFINGLLDKVLKRVLAEQRDAAEHA